MENNEDTEKKINKKFENDKIMDKNSDNDFSNNDQILEDDNKVPSKLCRSVVFLNENHEHHEAKRSISQSTVAESMHPKRLKHLNRFTEYYGWQVYNSLKQIRQFNSHTENSKKKKTASSLEKINEESKESPSIAFSPAKFDTVFKSSVFPFAEQYNKDNLKKDPCFKSKTRLSPQFRRKSSVEIRRQNAFFVSDINLPKKTPATKTMSRVISPESKLLIAGQSKIRTSNHIKLIKSADKINEKARKNESYKSTIPETMTWKEFQIMVEILGLPTFENKVKMWDKLEKHRSLNVKLRSAASHLKHISTKNNVKEGFGLNEVLSGKSLHLLDKKKTNKSFAKLLYKKDGTPASLTCSSSESSLENFLNAYSNLDDIESSLKDPTSPSFAKLKEFSQKYLKKICEDELASDENNDIFPDEKKTTILKQLCNIDKKTSDLGGLPEKCNKNMKDETGRRFLSSDLLTDISDDVTSKSKHDVTSRTKDDVTGRSIDDDISRSRDDVTSRSRHDVTSRSRDDITSRSRDDITNRTKDDITSRSRDDVTSRTKDDVTSRSVDDDISRTKDDVTSRSIDDDTGRSRDDVTSRTKDDDTGRSRDDVTSRTKDDDTGRSIDDVTSRSRNDVVGRNRDYNISRSIDYVTSRSDDEVTGRRRDDVIGRGKHDVTSRSMYEVTRKSKNKVIKRSKSKTTSRSRNKVTKKRRDDVMTKSVDDGNYLDYSEAFDDEDDDQKPKHKDRIKIQKEAPKTNELMHVPYIADEVHVDPILMLKFDGNEFKSQFFEDEPKKSPKDSIKAQQEDSDGISSFDPFNQGHTITLEEKIVFRSDLIEDKGLFDFEMSSLISSETSSNEDDDGKHETVYVYHDPYLVTLLADPEVDDVPVPKPVKKVKEVKPSRTIEPPLQPPTNLCVYDRKEELTDYQPMIFAQDKEIKDMEEKIRLYQLRQKEKVKNQPWLLGRMSFSRQVCRFDLPVDMRQLNDLSAADYLCDFCLISPRRTRLYLNSFERQINQKRKRYLFKPVASLDTKESEMGVGNRSNINLADEESNRTLSLKETAEGIKDVHHVGISDKQIEELFEMLQLTSAEMRVSSKLFMALCALTERLYFSNFSRIEDERIVSGKEAAERLIIEVTDFCNLKWKLEGIKLSEGLQLLFKVLKATDVS